MSIQKSRKSQIEDGRNVSTTKCGVGLLDDFKGFGRFVHEMHAFIRLGPAELLIASERFDAAPHHGGNFPSIKR